MLDRDADRRELAQITKLLFRPRLTGDHHKTSVVHTRSGTAAVKLVSFAAADASIALTRLGMPAKRF